MKRFTSLTLVLGFLFSSVASAQPAPSQTPPATAPPGAAPRVVLVPGGTPIYITFLQPVSSDDATVGATVPVAAERNVYVGGMVVVAQGAEGEATLTTVQHSAHNGSGGKIIFTIDWVTSVDGGKIALAPTSNQTDNADRKGAASTLSIVGYATFGLAGLFAHDLARGRAAIIKPDQVFTVFVDHTIHVTSAVPAPAGFDN